MTSDTDAPGRATMPLADLLDNLAAEIGVAEEICVSVEDIVTTRLCGEGKGRDPAGCGPTAAREDVTGADHEAVRGAGDHCGPPGDHGVTTDDVARIGLQNVDRLLQMLCDFRTLLTHLGKASEGLMVDATAAGAHLVMDDLRRRLLTPGTRQGTNRTVVAPSEVTFF